MPARTRLTFEERKALLDKVLREGVSVSQASREFGVSRTAFYKWIRRFRKYGEAGLLEQTPSGKKHWNRTPSGIELRVLEMVGSHPEYSSKRIADKIGRDDQGRQLIGNHGVQNIFERYGLSKQEGRLEYACRVGQKVNGEIIVLPAVKRLELVERVMRGELDVSEACRGYGVSRPTFYKWKRRLEALEDEATYVERLAVFSDQRPSGSKHWNAVDPIIARKVLDLVVNKPVFSSHKLAKRIDGVGNHGVQNILAGHDLSIFGKRLAYSRAKVVERGLLVRPITAWLGRLKQVWEQFLPTRAPAPPPKIPFGTWLQRQRRFAPYYLFSLFFLFGLYKWGRLLGSATTASQAIGWIFASVALSMGTVFFLYSLKYYFTLAVVLSFSREALDQSESIQTYANGSWLSRLFGLRVDARQISPSTSLKTSGLEPDLSQVKLERHPFISIHLPMYNEKRVAERILKACTSFNYPSTSSGQARYEIIVADDSTDETIEIVRRFAEAHNQRQVTTNKKQSNFPLVKVIHRDTREGFKGGALKEALKHTDPRAEFIVVFDADFVPYPDTLELFLKYFQTNAGSLNPKRYTLNPIAAIQGYQWHVLNKSENWITRGVRSEYAGSYVIERSGEELYGGLKQIAGSVYMIRRDLVDRFGWGTSLTEDFQLTLRLYEQGYKVVYTPYIQAPSECVSTLKRLIRQRMRWAEGHSFNIRRMFTKLLFGKWEEASSKFKVQNVQVDRERAKRRWIPSPLTFSEKLEFFYLSPYYLQAAFFLLGTFCWLLSETIFRVRLPFWTAVWGWSLVLTNILSLPLMNSVGLFLEEAEERDFSGIFSFILLSYILVPFQAYASVKGFLEPEEGPWFRTPKTGMITDILTRGRFYRFIRGIFPGRGTPVVAKALAGSQAMVPLLDGSIVSNLEMKQFSNLSLSLATANQKFSGFVIRRRNARWLGKLIVSLFLALSTTLVSLAPGISVMDLREAQAFGMVLGPSGQFFESDASRDNGQSDINREVDFSATGSEEVGKEVPLAVRYAEDFADLDVGEKKELVLERNETSKTFIKKDEGKDEPTFVWEGQIGSTHYKDDPNSPNEQWKEIDTTLESSQKQGFDYQMIKSGYHAYFAKDFSSKEVVKFEKDNYWLSFKPTELVWLNERGDEEVIARPQKVLGEVSDNKIYWKEAFGPGMDLEWFTTNSRLAKRLIIKHPSYLPEPSQKLKEGGNHSLELRIAFENSPELSLDQSNIDGRVTFRDRNSEGIWEFTQPLYWGSGEGEERKLGKREIKNVEGRWVATMQIPHAEIQGIDFPLFVDVDVDKQVEVLTNNDGYEYSGAGSGWSGTYGLRLGLGGGYYYHTAARWTSVTVPQGSTITSAYVSLLPPVTYSQTWELTQWGILETNPAIFSSTSKPSGRPQTTAYVEYDSQDWTADMWEKLPDVTSVIQEIVGQGGFESGNAMAWWIKTDSANTNMNLYSYDDDSAKAPKLHIEYTPKLGTSTSSLATGYSFQRKTFYDSENNRYWSFFHDGDEIDIYYSSDDGANWNAITSLAYDTNDFSVWWETVSGTEYVWIAYVDGYDVKARRGTLGTSSITWDALTYTPYDGDSSTNEYDYPMITRDSNGKLWITARHYLSQTTNCYATTSDGKIWGSDFGSAEGDWNAARATSDGCYDFTEQIAATSRYYAPDVQTYIERSFIPFDTSAISSGATVTAVSIYFKWRTDSDHYCASTTHEQNYVKKYSFSDDFCTTDRETAYDGALSATTDVQLPSCSGFSSDDYTSQSGLDTSWVSKGAGAVTKYAIVGETDNDNSYPGEDRGVGYYSADRSGTTDDPYLAVTYYVYYQKAIQSSSANDVSSWASSVMINSSSNSNQYGVVVPLNSGDMYAAFVDGTSIKGCFYDEQGNDRWENSSGADCTDGANQDSIDTGVTGLSKNVSAVIDAANNDVHLLYIEDDTIDTVSYARWDNGSGINGSWQGEITLDSSDDYAYVTISIDSDTDDLYALWMDTAVNDILYRTCDKSGASSECSDVSDWATKVDWKDTTSGVYITSNYSGPTRIFAQWTEGAGSPYDVFWDAIIIPERLWLWFGLAPILPLVFRHRKRRMYASVHAM